MATNKRRSSDKIEAHYSAAILGIIIVGKPSVGANICGWNLNKRGYSHGLIYICWGYLWIMNEQW